MLDGNVLLHQKRDEVPEGTLSCPDRNLAVFHHYRHYEGLRLLPSVCDSKLNQQTLLTRVSCIFILIGECTLMDLCLLDIKLIIRIVIEEVKKYNVLYEYLSAQFNEKVQNFVPKFEITKI